MSEILTGKKALVALLKKFVESKEYKEYIERLKENKEENIKFIESELEKHADYSKCLYSINDAELVSVNYILELAELCKGIQDDEFYKEIEAEAQQMKSRIVDHVDMGQSRDWRVYSGLDRLRFENRFIKYITGDKFPNGAELKPYILKKIEELENSIENEEKDEVIEE